MVDLQTPVRVETRSPFALAGQALFEVTGRALSSYPLTAPLKHIFPQQREDLFREVLTFGAAPTRTFNPDYHESHYENQPQLSRLAGDLTADVIVPGHAIVTNAPTTPGGWAAALALEGLGLVPIAGYAAKGVRAGVGLGRSARSATGAYLRGPFAAVAHPFETIGSVGRGIDLAVNPLAVPISSIEATRSTLRLPVTAFEGAADTARRGLARPTRSPAFRCSGSRRKPRWAVSPSRRLRLRSSR